MLRFETLEPELSAAIKSVQTICFLLLNILFIYVILYLDSIFTYSCSN